MGVAARIPYFGAAIALVRFSLAISQIFDVDVCPEPSVIGQVPSVMIGVVVDYDTVAVPQPVVAETVIIRCYAEVESVEEEPFPISSPQMPDMAFSDASGKAAVFKGMVQVIVRIVTASIVSHPLIIGMDVRSFRVSGLVRRKISPFVRPWCFDSRGRLISSGF